ncbi:MAG: YggS family pyridoxal phosphate-dependent enzyme [Eubacteriales bacterium]
MSANLLTNIEKNLAFVRQNMIEYQSNLGVKDGDITLVAVSKRFDISYIQTAMGCGQLDFGENRVQEFVEKSEQISSPVKWHFIGHLQTNKVKYVWDKIHLLHSLDSIKLAETIHRQVQQHDSTLDALIQVNISKESTKSGIYKEEVNEFIESISKLDGVRVKGLMTMAPLTDDETLIRKTFSGLRQLFDKLDSEDLPSNIEMKYISMGMSGDYKLALQEGSNMIRIGSGIFGPRMY